MKGGQTQLLRWQQLAHAIVNKAIVDYSDSYISDRGAVGCSRRMMMDVRRFLKSDLFKDVLCQLDPRLNGVTIESVKEKLGEYMSTTDKPTSLDFYKWARTLRLSGDAEPSWWGPEGGAA